MWEQTLRGAGAQCLRPELEPRDVAGHRQRRRVQPRDGRRPPRNCVRPGGEGATLLVPKCACTPTKHKPEKAQNVPSSTAPRPDRETVPLSISRETEESIAACFDNRRRRESLLPWRVTWINLTDGR